MLLPTFKSEDVETRVAAMGQDKIILRLTFFWIFAEGGLGGIMHLLHIPLTGFLVGGFSIIINILIAYLSNDSKQFFKALLLVLLAKFILSPYSPVGAYVAVFFQGILAIVIFPIFKLNPFTVFSYAVLVMLESALQKPLMAYLIFGKELGQGIVIFINDFFHSDEATALILKLLIALYFGLYILWAFFIGNLALRFIKQYKNFESSYGTSLKNIVSPPLKLTPKKSKSEKRIRLVLLSLPLVGLSLLSVFAKEQSAPLYLLKTVLLLAFFYVLLPHFLVFLQKRNSNKVPDTIRAAHELFPMMYQNALQANVLSQEHKGYKRLEVFVHLVVWLNIFYDAHEA